MGLDVIVSIYWGVAYSSADLEIYSQSGLGDLSSCLGPQALEELVKFWETDAGRAKRRCLRSRLQKFADFSLGLLDTKEDCKDMFAESGCDAIDVVAVGSCRDYGLELEEESTFIVGFNAVDMIIQNPQLFDPSELTIGVGWKEQLRRFTACEGLPYDSDEGNLYCCPDWLICASLSY